MSWDEKPKYDESLENRVDPAYVRGVMKATTYTCSGCGTTYTGSQTCASCENAKAQKDKQRQVQKAQWRCECGNFNGLWMKYCTWCHQDRIVE